MGWNVSCALSMSLIICASIYSSICCKTHNAASCSSLPKTGFDLIPCIMSYLTVNPLRTFRVACRKFFLVDSPQFILFRQTASSLEARRSGCFCYHRHSHHNYHNNHIHRRIEIRSLYSQFRMFYVFYRHIKKLRKCSMTF